MRFCGFCSIQEESCDGLGVSWDWGFLADFGVALIDNVLNDKFVTPPGDGVRLASAFFTNYESEGPILYYLTSSAKFMYFFACTSAWSS